MKKFKRSARELPPTLTSLVFGYLNVSEVANCRLVFEQWSTLQATWSFLDVVEHTWTNLLKMLSKSHVRRVLIGSGAWHGTMQPFDETLADISESCHNLESLDVFCAEYNRDGATAHQLTDTSLSYLSKLQNLVELKIDGGYVTDIGLLCISNLTMLRLVHLTSCRAISDSGLKHLWTLPYLRNLNLDYTSVNDASILGFRRLEVFSANCTNLGNKSLRVLVQLNPTKELDFFGCANISDEGVVYLYNTGVSAVDLACTSVTEEAVNLLCDERNSSLRYLQDPCRSSKFWLTAVRS